MRIRFFRNLIIIFLVLVVEFSSSLLTEAKNINDYTKDELHDLIEKMYNNRSAAFVSGDLSTLKNDFDTSQKYGQWSLEQEIRRGNYLQDWSSARGICFTNITSEVRLKKVSPSKGNIRIALDETYNFEYIYNQDMEPVTNRFGVGLRHTIVLKQSGETLKIYSDWYTDCFQDALKAYNGNIENIKTPQGPLFTLGNCTKVYDINSKGRYNRLKAAAYADKYCGIANGRGNNFKYNKKYRDYTGIGGDCTNFASQVLGDKEGGGLKQDGSWMCDGNSNGSSAWVNADAFRNYLLYSGKAVLVKKGTFKESALPNKNFPCGIISKLELGDLVCYAKGSNMDHFAIVTGWDSHGYPLVNSHTTDRYHVPWDLGWGDNGIYFHLIHIR